MRGGAAFADSALRRCCLPGRRPRSASASPACSPSPLRCARSRAAGPSTSPGCRRTCVRGRSPCCFTTSWPPVARAGGAATRRGEGAVEQTRDSDARFTLELADAALQYIRGHFETALATSTPLCAPAPTSARIPGSGWPPFRRGILAVVDRFDEALAEAAEGIRSAQQGRQGRALQLLETSRARQLLQLGHLDDAAAALEGRFSPDEAHLILSVLDADGVVVLGRIALHTANQRQTELTRRSPGSCSRPGCRLSSGTPRGSWPCRPRPRRPRPGPRWLRRLTRRRACPLFPIFPLDPADDPQLVRIALASGDRELADRPRRCRAASRAQPRYPCRPGQRPPRPGLLTGDSGLLAQAVSILKPASGGSRWPPPSRIWAWQKSGLAAGTRRSPPSTARWPSTPPAGPAGTWPGSAAASGNSGSSAACR